jgi:hypothetical protein
MPSFSEIVGVIVTAVVLTVASGRGELVLRTLGELRRVSMTQAHQGWGCPSIFAGKGACTSYDPSRYR